MADRIDEQRDRPAGGRKLALQYLDVVIKSPPLALGRRVSVTTTAVTSSPALNTETAAFVGFSAKLFSACDTNPMKASNDRWPATRTGRSQK